VPRLLLFLAPFVLLLAALEIGDLVRRFGPLLRLIVACVVVAVLTYLKLSAIKHVVFGDTGFDDPPDAVAYNYIALAIGGSYLCESMRAAPDSRRSCIMGSSCIQGTSLILSADGNPLPFPATTRRTSLCQLTKAVYGLSFSYPMKLFPLSSDFNSPCVIPQLSWDQCRAAR
jgi:hypothetical protein